MRKNACNHVCFGWVQVGAQLLCTKAKLVVDVVAVFAALGCFRLRLAFGTQQHTNLNKLSLQADLLLEVVGKHTDIMVHQRFQFIRSL